MNPKHKPATPLPWRLTDYGMPNENPYWYNARLYSGERIVTEIAVTNGVLSGGADGRPNAEYIVHAANAYPKLVEALREAAAIAWKALGGADDEENKERADRMTAKFDALLRELGEE